MDEKAKPLRAASYARTSTLLKQDPNLQLTHIKEFLHHRRMVLVREYVDQITGTTDRRPALDELLADIRRGRIDVVVIAALDRLGRNALHVLKLAEIFREYNVGLISLREAIDLNSASGRAFFQILASISELDRNQISERIKTALAAKKLIAERTGSSWKCGRPSIMTPETVSRVLELKALGKSIRVIAKELGIAKSSVQRILAQSPSQKPIGNKR